jgi:hypothetical protein
MWRSFPRILIFGIPRSGTHLFFNLMSRGRGSECHCEAEPFNTVRLMRQQYIAEPFTEEEWTKAMQDKFDTIMGWPQFYSEFVLKLNPNEIDALNAANRYGALLKFNTYNILVVRQDLVEHTLSLAISALTNQFHTPVTEKLVLTEELVDECIATITDGLNGIAAGLYLPYFDEIVLYEDILAFVEEDETTPKKFHDKRQTVEDYGRWVEYIKLRVNQLSSFKMTVRDGKLKRLTFNNVLEPKKHIIR